MNNALADDRAGMLPRHGIYRILICRPNHRLGNMLLMTPLIAELERRYPGAEIDIVAEGNLARDVFATCFSVKNIYCLPRRGFKHPVGFLAPLSRIRKTQYDLIIDPCMGSGFSRTLTRIFHARYKLGFDSLGRPAGLTQVVPEAAAAPHMAKRPISLLRAGLSLDAGDSPDFPRLDIRLADSERASGKACLHNLLAACEQPEVAGIIGVFADATGRKRYAKAWWDEFMATLTALCPRNRIVEIVPMHGRSMLDSRWPAYYSSSIRHMAAVMAGVDLMISADSGVMHLAVASGAPTAGLFAVTDADIYGPYGDGNTAIRTQDVPAGDVARRIAGAYPRLFGTPVVA